MTDTTNIPKVALKSLSTRSRVTNGRTPMLGADGRSAWVRRWKDLTELHVGDLGGPETLSEGQTSLCRRAATLEVICEQLEARMSEGNETPEDITTYNVTTGNLRRILELIGLERKPRVVDDGANTLVDYFSKPAPKGTP